MTTGAQTGRHNHIPFTVIRGKSCIKLILEKLAPDLMKDLKVFRYYLKQAELDPIGNSSLTRAEIADLLNRTQVLIDQLSVVLHRLPEVLRTASDQPDKTL